MRHYSARGLVGFARLFHVLLATLLAVPSSAAPSDGIQQVPLQNDDDGPPDPAPISVQLFSSFERMSRLVDISYCVGTTGISEPFTCASRCSEFPTLTLAMTWNTGMLMSDSCGYVAVDHGERRRGYDEGDEEEKPDGPRPDVGLGEKAIVVAFRGTYSIANTIVDLSTVPQAYVPYPSPDDGAEQGQGQERAGSRPKPSHRCDNCTVHSGFLESWRQARKVVVPELEALRAEYPGYPVQLVGHSLGGAVALLAALELRVSLGWEDTLVTTFGEPKAGNQLFCDYVDAVFELDGEEVVAKDAEGGHEEGRKDIEGRMYRRVTHVADPVPLLPLAEWGYRSHGGEFFIAKKELSPSLGDVVACRGQNDMGCIARDDVQPEAKAEAEAEADIVVGTGPGAGHRVEAVAEVVSKLNDPKEPKVKARVETDQDAGASDVRLAKRDLLASVPPRFRLWQLFFAHRDYFWRIGLCLPGGDPANWGREKYPGPTEPGPEQEPNAEAEEEDGRPEEL